MSEKILGFQVRYLILLLALSFYACSALVDNQDNQVIDDNTIDSELDMTTQMQMNAPDISMLDMNARDRVNDAEADSDQPECINAVCDMDTICVSGMCIVPAILTVELSKSSLQEGSEESAIINVYSSRELEFAIEVDLRLSGEASDDDVALASRNLTISEGSSQVSTTLQALSDQEIEQEETLIISISSRTPGALIGVPSNVSLQIIDNDRADEVKTYPARNSKEWLWQDVVIGNPSADPYCYSADTREEARINTQLGYIRTDAHGDEGGISVMVPAFNPEWQQWEQRSLTTFDFRPYAESQPGSDGVPSGLDIFEGEGQYVSIVGTSDGGGVAGWASSWGDGCQLFDAWISYEPNNLPDLDTSNRDSWATVSSPIGAAPYPTWNNCPMSFGTTTTRWAYVRDFEFAADSTCQGDNGRKVMDTIVSDHDGGDHHEVFYFTDEYGSKTRWERWECGIPYPETDFITARCRYNESQSVMHKVYGIDNDRRVIASPNGNTCYMTDCRDFTRVETLEPSAYLGAAWHHSAMIYYSGNILRNGDLNLGNDQDWDSVNTNAEVRYSSNGNHYLHVSTDDTGWHSISNNSIAEFNSFFNADTEAASDTKYLHWGARVRHMNNGGTARLALIEWGNPSGQIIDERLLSLSSDWQWVSFHRPMAAETNSLDLRFRLDELTGLEIDDVYIYISDEEGQ